MVLVHSRRPGWLFGSRYRYIQNESQQYLFIDNKAGDTDFPLQVVRSEDREGDGAGG